MLTPYTRLPSLVVPEANATITQDKASDSERVDHVVRCLRLSEYPSTARLGLITYSEEQSEWNKYPCPVLAASIPCSAGTRVTYWW